VEMKKRFLEAVYIGNVFISLTHRKWAALVRFWALKNKLIEGNNEQCNGATDLIHYHHSSGKYLYDLITSNFGGNIQSIANTRCK
jgi:hypothetical protein